MANSYLSAAYAQNLPSGQKSVLVALANRANKAGLCFPSVRCISSDTGLGRSTIHAHLKKLVEQGLVKKTHQYRKDRSQSSNLYKLLLDPAKKTVKKVKKVFREAVEIGKSFNPARLTDHQTIKLEWGNYQLWDKVSDCISDAVAAQYPEADELSVLDLISKHLCYWAEATRTNKKLRLTAGKLKTTFLEQYRLELNYLNTVGHGLVTRLGSDPITDEVNSV